MAWEKAAVKDGEQGRRADVRAQSGLASPGRGGEGFRSVCPFGCLVGLGCPCLQQSRASICRVQAANCRLLATPIGRTWLLGRRPLARLETHQT